MRGVLCVVVVVLLLLNIHVPPALFQVTSLVQVDPEEGDPICWNSNLTYNCTVLAAQLIWRYMSPGMTTETQSYFSFDTPSVDKPNQLGPFDVVLVGIVSMNDSYVMESTATIRDELTNAVDGQSISCTGIQQELRTISITEPTILNAEFCNRTISWTPPVCDANCTVSVDGQEDIGPISCSVGSVTTMEFIESTKEVIIIAVDGLGRAVDVEVQANTSTDCVATNSTTNISDLELLSSSSGPCDSNEEYVYKIQDTSLNYIVIETGSGNEVHVHFSISEDSTFQLIYDAKCGKSYEVQVKTQVLATVEAKSCSGFHTCVILIPLLVVIVFIFVGVSVFAGMVMYMYKCRPEKGRKKLNEETELGESSACANQRSIGQFQSSPVDAATAFVQPHVGPDNTEGNGSTMNPGKAGKKQSPNEERRPVVPGEPNNHPSKILVVRGSQRNTRQNVASTLDADPSNSSAGNGMGNIPGTCNNLLEEPTSGGSSTSAAGAGGQHLSTNDKHTTIPVKKSMKFKDGEAQKYTDKGPASSVTHCKLSLRAAHIAIAIVCKSDWKVRVLKCDTGEVVRTYKSACVLTLEWLELHSTNALVVADGERLRCFDIKKNEDLMNVKLDQFLKSSRVTCVACCAKNDKPVFALADFPTKQSDSDHCIGHLMIIGDGDKKNIGNSLQYSKELTSQVSCMIFNQSGTQLITGNLEGKITVFCVQENDNRYSVTMSSDWTASQGLIYNFQYSYKSDQHYLFSIGKDDEFLVHSNLSASKQHTTKVEIHPGAVLDVESAEKVHAPSICGQFFCVLPFKGCYFLTSSNSQGIIYKFVGGKINDELILSPCGANITCVDWRSGDEGEDVCIMGCADSSVHVIKFSVKV